MSDPLDFSNSPAAELPAGGAPDKVVSTGGYSDSEGQRKDILKVALTALAGTSIEFYDFFLYGTAAALVFPSVFFPKDNSPLVGLLASFSTFAIGFFARPAGAMVFGHFGDRVGRKSTLVIALVLMGISTTLIGCLPTYESVGLLAPALLVFLRIMQGFALGGQWGGAVLIITESAPKGRRGFYGSFAQMGAPIGTILANVAFLSVSVSVTPSALLSWAWRIPFLFSVLLIAIGVFIQLNLKETPAFRRLNENHMNPHALPVVDTAAEVDGDLRLEPVRLAPEITRHRYPVAQVLRRHPKEILVAAGIFLGMQVSFYILVAFSVAYGTKASGLNLPSSTMLTAVLFGATAMIPGIFLGSIISDQHGRRGILMLSAFFLGIWSFAIFPLINTGSLLWIAVAVCVGQLFNGMIFGPLAALFSEMFETSVRYSGASLGYQIGTLLGGALAPLIATALFARFQSWVPIAVYMSTACAVTIFSASRLPDTRAVDMATLGREAR